jgi:hypothetical protein
VGVLSDMVAERHYVTYCTKCATNTRQRYLIMHPRWILLLTLLSCGTVLPFLWIFLHLGYNKSTTCERCGTFNSLHLPNPRQGDTSGQYASKVERNED